MSPQFHALVGSLAILVNLVVGVWGLTASRRCDKPSGTLRAAALVGFGLLALQVLIGVDLASTGALPAPGSALFSAIHMIGPIGALLGSVYHDFFSRRNRVRNYGVAGMMTLVLGLISFVIGEMGPRLV